MAAGMIFTAAGCGGEEEKKSNSNLDAQIHAGKAKVSMRNLKQVGDALAEYVIEEGNAPEGDSLAAITGQLVPRFIKTIPLNDGYGNEILYKHGNGEQKHLFFLASTGADGKFDGWDQEPGKVPHDLHSPGGYDKDILYSNKEIKNGGFDTAPIVR